MDPSNVIVALSGAIYVAPIGSPAPSAATEPLGSAWKSLGYLSDDGVTENDFADTSDIVAWQHSSVVRRTVIKRGTTYNFIALETNATVLDMFYGQVTASQPVPPSGDIYTYEYLGNYGIQAARQASEFDIYTPNYEARYGSGATPAQPGTVVIGNSREHRLSMVIDIVDRATVIRRYIPNGVIVERGDVRMNSYDPMAYPFQASALPDPTIGGTVLCMYNRALRA